MTHARLFPLLVLAAACGSSTPNTTGPIASHAAAGDAAVKEGEGWTRTAPGVWAFDDDHDTPWSQKLGTEPGGRGIQWMKLPAGAHRAKLVAFSVGYAAPGRAKWSLYSTDASETPSGTPLATISVTITPDQVMQSGGKGIWTRHALVTPMALTANPNTQLETFDLVFETVSGQPAVAAFDGEDGSQVRYQAPGATKAEQTKWTAYVRAELVDVE